MGLTHYVWDELSDNVLQETDDIGVTTVEYTCEPNDFGAVLSQRRNVSTYIYHYDGSGSTRQLTDQTGLETDRYKYDAWGNEISSFGTTENPYRFCGQHSYYTDQDTGDVYIRARSYQPSAGRWLSADPLRLADGPNAYLYALNQPVTNTDPSGLSCGNCTVNGLQYKSLGCHISRKKNGEPILMFRHFRIRALFAPPDCGCCEFRQQICGQWRHRFRFFKNGKFTPALPWKIVREEPKGGGCKLGYREDADLATGEIYGQRSDPNRPHSKYTPNRATGCQFDMSDSPDLGITANQRQVLRQHAGIAMYEYQMQLSFRHSIVDTCCDGTPREFTTKTHCCYMVTVDPRNGVFLAGSNADFKGLLSVPCGDG